MAFGGCGWFRVIADGFRWFRVVLGGFGLFWVVCCFSSHESKHGQIPNFVLRGLRKRWHSSMKEACPNDEPYLPFCDNLEGQIAEDFTSVVNSQGGKLWYGVPNATYMATC